MKTIYHICIYITLLASTLFTTASCEDWLEVKSPTSRPTVDFFQTPVQAEQALLGISPVNSFIFKSCFKFIRKDTASNSISGKMVRK